MALKFRDVPVDEIRKGDIVSDGGILTLVLGRSAHMGEMGLTLKDCNGYVWSAYYIGGTMRRYSGGARRKFDALLAEED